MLRLWLISGVGTTLERMTMEDFMRHKPAKFSSKATLDEADAQKLTFITFLLVVDVEYWW